MRSDRHRYAVCFAGLLSALFVFQGLVSLAHAADVKALLNQVNKELRQVQRDMFGGAFPSRPIPGERVRRRPNEAGERLLFFRQDLVQTMASATRIPTRRAIRL